jgi:hypothetical protein
MVEGTGFEPVYSKRAELQSAAINHSATPPHCMPKKQFLRRFVNMKDCLFFQMINQ